MKVRVASKEPSIKIGASGLTGKALVIEEDKMGYSCYDVVLEAGTSLDIKSAFGNNTNHIYYCVYGKIVFKCSEGTTETLKTDHLIALTGKMEANINAIEKTRLFLTYVRENPEKTQPEKAFYYTLDQILGTERDVDWFNGRSRRYLRQAEGFNISLHNTTCHAGENTSWSNLVFHDTHF